jgi:hypothetical protein
MAVRGGGWTTCSDTAFAGVAAWVQELAAAGLADREPRYR